MKDAIWSAKSSEIGNKIVKLSVYTILYCRKYTYFRGRFIIKCERNKWIMPCLLLMYQYLHSSSIKSVIITIFFFCFQVGKTFLLELETTPSSSVMRPSIKQSPLWNGSAGVRIIKGLFPAANLFEFPSISIYLKSQTYEIVRGTILFEMFYIHLSFSHKAIYLSQIPSR